MKNALAIAVLALVGCSAASAGTISLTITNPDITAPIGGTAPWYFDLTNGGSFDLMVTQMGFDETAPIGIFSPVYPSDPLRAGETWSHLVFGTYTVDSGTFPPASSYGPMWLGYYLQDSEGLKIENSDAIVPAGGCDPVLGCSVTATEAVPEPASLGLLMLGSGGLFLLKRKRR
jgi:hypothetical protein